MKLTATEARALQDVTTLKRIRKEHDELRQTAARLHSEHAAAHDKCDWARQERDIAQQ